MRKRRRETGGVYSGEKTRRVSIREVEYRVYVLRRGGRGRGGGGGSGAEGTVRQGGLRRLGTLGQTRRRFPLSSSSSSYYFLSIERLNVPTRQVH